MLVLEESFWYQQIFNEGYRRELIPGIELGLELKFGAEGLQLMPEISQIADLDVLKTIREGLRKINSLEEIRQIYTINET